MVEGRQGVGTFVARRPQGPPPGIQARLARTLHGWVESARGEGMDDEAMEALLRDTLRSDQATRIAWSGPLCRDPGAGACLRDWKPGWESWLTASTWALAGTARCGCPRGG